MCPYGNTQIQSGKIPPMKNHGVSYLALWWLEEECAYVSVIIKN